jgi:hypothetical protein
MRVTAGTLVGLVASGHSESEILAAYPFSKPKTFAKPWHIQRGGSKKWSCRFLRRENTGRSALIEACWLRHPRHMS